MPLALSCLLISSCTDEAARTSLPLFQIDILRASPSCVYGDNKRNVLPGKNNCNLGRSLRSLCEVSVFEESHASIIPTKNRTRAELTSRALQKVR
jgi:hypothetical protein